MPRKPRQYVGGVPCHIVQRGNNRSVCFFSEEDYQAYLEYLYDACLRYAVNMHAYVLMTNHTHLLMTPQCKDGISLVMQSLGRRYVQYINHQYRRSGTLWEGRHKSSLVQAEQYLLACYRYIELNPVRACMVDHPGEYRWSSYHANALGAADKRITPHDLYEALGQTAESRQHAYRGLFTNALDKDIVQAIRVSAQFSMPMGNSRFKAEIEQALKRKLGYAQRGRPVKSVGSGV